MLDISYSAIDVKRAKNQENGAGWLQTNNKQMQLSSRWSLRPSADGLAGTLACSQGIPSIQAPHSLRMTTRNAPVRNGNSTVQTTSAFVGPLCEITLSNEGVIWKTY